MAEIRVNVSSVGSKGTAQATNNAAQYWAEKAREWAISENPVSMEDNSSKYYAGKAKEYAQSAQQYKNDTQEIADTAESNIDDLTSDFSSLYTEKSEALQSEYSNYSSSLEAAKTSAITSIQTTGTEVNTSITTASTSALSDITTAKNTAVEDIQDEADTQISNIQSTGFYMRDGRLYYVDSEGQEQEFKSGEGLPLLSIRPALYVDESLGLDYYLNGQLLTVNANLQGAVNALKSLQAKNPSLFTTEEEWQAEKEASDHGQVGKLVLNYAQAEVEKQCSIFGGEDILTSEENYWLVEKAKNDVEVGDLAYPCDSSGTKTGDDAAAITAVWTGTYTGEPIISITESGNNGKSFYSEVTLTETVTTDEIVSFRLPAVVNVQGLLDLQNLGMTVKAGLPNLTLYTTRQNNRASGGYAKAGTTYVENLSFLASSQNPIYGASDTVQEEAIQYPWVIRLATGQETEVNIRNDIELNNPFFFGMSQYFDVEPNNLSWLKSDGMYKPKSVYPDYYNWILENVNKGVEGFKGQEGYCFIATDSSGYYWWVSTESPVVGASVYRYDAGVNSMFFSGTVETLTSNGFTFTSIFEGSSYTVTRDSSKDTSILHPAAWITDYDFVINTSAETFRLPLLDGSEWLVSDRYIDLTLQASGTKYAAVANGFVFFEKLNTSNTQFVKGTNLSSGYADISYGTYSGSTPSILLKVKRGDIFSIDYDAAGVTNSFRIIYARGDGSLYYYVGETVQNANLIDAGRMQEQITNINAPSRGYLVQSYVNGTSGYRVYSDGWCEQWGKSNSTSGQETITLTKAYNSINFTVLATSYTNNFYGTAQIINNKTIWIESRGHDFTVQPCLVRWLTMGYIS